MRQLSSRDAAYLYLGDRHSSATVVSAWVLDSSASAPPAADVILARLRAMAAIDEHLTCRVQFVPFSLGLPYWRRDPDFTVARHHVRHEPGRAWPEATRLLADIADRRLPIDRPLWSAHLIPNVSGVPGQPGDATIFAIVWHHAAFDGLRWTQLTRFALADPTDHRGPEPDGWSVGESPGGARGLAVRELARAPVTWWRFLSGIVRRAAATRKRVGMSEVGERPGPWARTRFSATLTGPRICSFVDLSLADAEAVKRAVPGATINDVLLSVIGDAVRQFLTDVGEPPGRSLGGLVPISTRTSNDGPVNQFTPVIVDLHDDIGDPLERVAAVSASASAAKARVGARQATPESPDLPAPLLRVLGALSRSRLFNGTSVGANVVITNIGPTRGVASMGGLPVDAMFGMQTLGSGCLLAHSIRTVDERLVLSVTTDGHVMPDPADYLQCIARSLDDHHTAAVGARRAPA